jgi:hypothetical protein
MKKIRFGAWLGLLALAVQFYLPVHLVERAASLSLAGIAAPPHATAHHHDHPALHLASHVSGETHHTGAPGEHPVDSRDHCPICSMLHAPSVVALAAGVELFRPTLVALGSTPVLQSYELASASVASYASRAPPPSIG